MSKKVVAEFPKAELQAVTGYEDGPLEEIQDRVVETTRWSIIHELIFRDTRTGKVYRTSYSVGATEYQDESPFDYSGDMISCVQVEEVEVVRKEWCPVEVTSA